MSVLLRDAFVVVFFASLTAGNGELGLKKRLIVLIHTVLCHFRSQWKKRYPNFSIGKEVHVDSSPKAKRTKRKLWNLLVNGLLRANYTTYPKHEVSTQKNRSFIVYEITANVEYQMVQK